MKAWMLWLCLGVCGVAWNAPSADAQAYCALRDPVKQIYQLFPEADNYRSVIRAVDGDARRKVSEQLPFTLHFNELGQHTLYVALRGSTPLGLVHVRSEAGRWGIVEIAWSLTLDLEVKGFAFQRCRDKGRAMLESPAVQARFAGRGFDDLRAMLSDDGGAMAPDAGLLSPRASGGEKALAVTALRSALKTIAVTRLAWRDDLTQIRWIHAGMTAFAGAASVEAVAAPNAADGTVVLRVRDTAGDALGVVVISRWQEQGMDTTLTWRVGAGGVLRQVTPARPWVDDEVAAAFDQLTGLRRSDLDQCLTTVDLTAKAVLDTATLCLTAEKPL